MNIELINIIKRETIKQIRLIINSHLHDCSNYEKVIEAVNTRIKTTDEILKDENYISKDLLSSNNS